MPLALWVLNRDDARGKAMVRPVTSYGRGSGDRRAGIDRFCAGRKV